MTDLVAAVPWGKRVGRALYVHRDTLERCAPKLFQWTEALAAEVGAGPDFNVIKFVVSAQRVSFLSYPDFFENPHPALVRAVSIRLESGTVTHQDYDPGANPPILHRKETLLEPTHPRYGEWKALTEAEEGHGLFDKPHRIGFRKNWEAHLAQKGLGYDGHQLVFVVRHTSPAGALPPEGSAAEPMAPVFRHKTALVRYQPSKPIQCLISHGLLAEKRTVLDYGCGRGDDVRFLNAMGYQAVGWDPVYCPQGSRRPADIVNLGYVLNVIEEPLERVDVLRDAYALAQWLLVVAVLTPGSGAAVSGRPYKDGILTARNTFQKYFRQHELESFLEETLEVPAVPAALGVFYVFKHPQDHQDFLSRRSRRVLRPAALDWEGILPRPAFVRRGTAVQRGPKECLFKENRELLEAFWQKSLELGRLPLQSEFDRYEAVCQRFGSTKKALRFLVGRFISETLERAAESRRKDLLVYVALANFRRRVPFELLPEGLQADIRFFWRSYPKALAQGREILFAAGNADLVARLCEETPFGHQDAQALYIHSSLIAELHPILRVYIGCAELLCGEARDADIVKIHKRSGKLSLLFYDDFFGNPFPELHTRIKVNLRTREVEMFDHRSAVRQEVLYFKERYVAPGHPDRERWGAVTRALQELGLELHKGYGPSKQELLQLATQHEWLKEMLEAARPPADKTPLMKETGFSEKRLPG